MLLEAVNISGTIEYRVPTLDRELDLCCVSDSGDNYMVDYLSQQVVSKRIIITNDTSDYCYYVKSSDQVWHLVSEWDFWGVGGIVTRFFPSESELDDDGK